MRKSTTTDSTKKLKRLSGYSALVLSVLSLDSSSQIVYTDIKDTALTNSGDFFDIDFNNDGTTDVSIEITKITGTLTSSCSLSVQAKSASILMSYAPYQVGYGAAAFALNDTICSSLYPNSFSSSDYFWEYNGKIKALGYGFLLRTGSDPHLAVRFKNNNDSLIGWVRLDTYSCLDSVVIRSFAYDSTSSCIVAGDTGNVPVGIPEIEETPINFYFAYGEIQVEGNLLPQSNIRIYDLQGKLLQDEFVSVNQKSITLRKKYQGVYIVELRNRNGVSRKKLWLEK